MNNQSDNTRLEQPPVLPVMQLNQNLDIGNDARTWRFAFRGKGLEYFKIWIVNLLLTIVTLSLYAPWAKVRRLRYFYGNTYLNRRKFDFTGIPSRILVGRLVALGLYIGMSIASSLSEGAALAGFVIAFIAIPWLFRSSSRFMARNSKYENCRFYFSAGMKHSYWVFFCCFSITLLSLGLLYPISLLWYKRWQLNHLYVGQLKFKFNAEAGDFYVAILLPSLTFFMVMLCAASLIGLTFITELPFELAVTVAAVLYFIAIVFIVPLIQGYFFKLIWSNVQIENSILKTDVSPWYFAWIKMTNNIAILLSFGLLYAWAMVRIYRYTIESLSLVFLDDPTQLYNQAQQDISAIGEEVADIFDIDISL